MIVERQDHFMHLLCYKKRHLYLELNYSCVWRCTTVSVGRSISSSTLYEKTVQSMCLMLAVHKYVFPLCNTTAPSCYRVTSFPLAIFLRPDLLKRLYRTHISFPAPVHTFVVFHPTFLFRSRATYAPVPAL